MGSATPPPKPRVLVVGMGGVGVMAAYALEAGGLAEVTAVCRSNYSTAIENGFTIDSIDHGRDIQNWKPTHVLATIPSTTEQTKFDYVLATTKNTPDIPPSLSTLLAPAITPNHTVLVLLQNGLNIEYPLIASFPTTPILSGISLIQASCISPTTILHDDHDNAKLGAFPTSPNLPLAQRRTREFLQLYNANGKTKWILDEDVTASRWRKLVYNASFNSVSAVLGGMDTTRMRTSGFIIDLLIRPAMMEVVGIAKAAKGVDLLKNDKEEGDLVGRMILLDDVRTEFVPSMGQDARKGNFMEIENIVGEPVREAERAGVPVPTLKTIFGLLKGIQLQMMEKKGLWKAEFQEGNPYS